MIRGFIPVRWWKKQEAVLQKVLLLYPDAMYANVSQIMAQDVVMWQSGTQDILSE